MTYYNKEGKTISLLQWAELFEDMEYRRIGLDKHGAYTVSTVWCGHNLTLFTKNPLIFESMIFCDDETNPLHHTCRRYSTFQEAQQGHTELVEKIRSRE